MLLRGAYIYLMDDVYTHVCVCMYIYTCAYF